MKSLQWLLAGLLMLAFTGTLLAQSAPASTSAPKGGVVGSGTVSVSVTTGGVLGCCARGIQGIPFSADVVHEFTQVLADGNRIHRETHGATFRDAEGRTRNENELDIIAVAETRTRITINDPVAGTAVTMFPETKTAVINHFRVSGLAGAPAAVNGGGAGVAGGKSPTELLEDLKKLRAEKGVSETPPKRQEFSTEQLGKKEIEGFTASGTRHVRTINAGAIGNDTPITTASESWFSEDLKVVILSVNDDPRSGQRTMRLTNIRLGDPDPQLFQVPADYTVRDIPLREEVVTKPLSPQ
jgi:hypothetical protein